MLATAQTGTGKTLGFLIPIVEMLQKVQDRNAAQALILLPTRELAMQVEAAFKTIRTSSQQTVALVVGGMQERPQLDAIRRGARLIVATPGRLAPRRVAANVSLLDVTPTLIDLAGGDSSTLDDTVDGRSLVPHLEAGTGRDEAAQRDGVLSRQDMTQPVRRERSSRESIRGKSCPGIFHVAHSSDRSLWPRPA